MGRWLQRRGTTPSSDLLEPASSTEPRLSSRRVEELCEALGVEVVHELLRTFRFASEDRLARLRGAAESDAAHAGFLAHELHGAAASVGADRLAALACGLETSSRTGDEAALRDLMRSTIDELEAVVLRLDRADVEPCGSGTSPLTPVHQRAESVDLTNGAGASGALDGGAYRVLLVDDAPELRLLGQSVLASAGYSVDVAADGLEALALISDGEMPDVVVLDVQMPEMDGWDTLAAIRANRATAHLPVIMCTVTQRPGCRIRARELGADGYVTKSYGVDHFEHVVTEVANRAAESRSRMRAFRGEMVVS